MYTEKNRQTIEQFFLWLRATCTPATIESYTYALKHLSRWCEENDLDIEAITYTSAMLYQRQLENRGLRSGARASYITAAKTLFRWLHRQGRFGFDPTTIPTPLVVDGRRHASLDPSEYCALLSVFVDTYPKDVRDKAIIAMLYNTGMRLGELLSMNVDCLDLSRRSAHIKTYKRRNHFREVYWTEEADTHIRAWLGVRSDYLRRRMMTASALWIGLDTNNIGTALKKGAVNRMFRVVRKMAGLEKKITPHTCRHGYGSEWARRKGNPFGLRDTLGHSSMKSTDIYTQLQNEDLRRMYNEVHIEERHDRERVPA